MTEEHGVLPIAFHDLPADKFPFYIRAHDSRNNNVVWVQKVSGPGPLHIPSLGARLIVRITWPDGTVEEAR